MSLRQLRKLLIASLRLDTNNQIYINVLLAFLFMFSHQNSIFTVIVICYNNVQAKRKMILNLSKANHFLKTLSGYDSSRKLEPAALHKQDQFHMEVHFLAIYPAAPVDITFYNTSLCKSKDLPRAYR